MAFSPFARRAEKKTFGPAALPAGERIYAVGDIHGRLDLLDQLATLISRDLKTAPAATTTIFLGDYIDRGKESAGVVERLSRSDFPTPFIALRGNHEEIALEFLQNDSVLESWRKYGGLETLHSYGVDVGDAMRGRGYDRAQQALAERIPASHLRFLQETRMSWSCGDYFFAHAGVRPGVALERQRPEDLLWIRDAFLRSDGDFGKIVVHGHTPVAAPAIHSNRINIDTGAFATSMLTALALEGSTRRFLTTQGAGARLDQAS